MIADASADSRRALLELLAFPPAALPERLIRALEAHEAAQAHDIAECARLVDQTGNPAMRLLLDLILDDQQRQQALLEQMIRRVHTHVEVSPSPTPRAAPADDVMVEAEAIVASVRALIRDAHEGARYLRHLARQEPDLYHGLYAVLLESMAREGEKHAYVLRYLLRRLEAQIPGSS